MGPILSIMTPPLMLQRSDGYWIVPDRWLQGMNDYCRLWNGPVEVLVTGLAEGSSELDNHDHCDLPFEIHVKPNPNKYARRLEEAGAVVLGGTFYAGADYFGALVNRGVPVVADTVHTLQTRMEIISCQVPNPFRRWKRYLAERVTERWTKRLLASIQGVQCKGTPTHDVYRDINPNTILYFDSRLQETDFISQTGFEARCQERLQKKPIELVFAGRLNAIKGVRDLPYVINELSCLGVNCHLHICGSGPEEAGMKHLSDKLGVSNRMTFHGYLPRDSHLFHLLKNQADLFVCSHWQGDPSHAYVEAMGCGIPVVGYNQESLLGFERILGCNLTARMRDARALAQLIASFANDRARLNKVAQKSLEFARKNTYDSNWITRIEHMKGCLK